MSNPQFPDINDISSLPPLPKANSETLEAPPLESEQPPIGIMDGDNPLIQRVQEAIFRQLSERDVKIELELREKEEAFRKAQLKREDVGVELYNLQQELVRFQQVLDSTEKKYSDTKQERSELEESLKNVTQEFNQKQAEKKQKLTNFEGQREELEKLTRALKQIQIYQEELESQLKVAKRSTLKVEEDMRLQEMEKKRQDYMIDQLEEQLRGLEDQKSQFEAQIKIQQEETKALMDMVQEAMNETEAIQFEKKQLLQQWKTSLLNLTRKDQELAEITSQITSNKDLILSLDAQISSFKQSQRKITEQREQLLAITSKLTSEIDYFKKQLAEIQEKRQSLLTEYQKYNSQLVQNEEEIEKLNKSSTFTRQETSTADHQLELVNRDIRKLEQKINDTLNDQLFLKKGNQGSRKDTSQLRAQIQEKESQLVVLTNEIAQLRLETLKINDLIESFKKEALNLNEQYNLLNKQIEKYDSEIKKNADDISKKQTEIDNLNKTLNSLSNRNEESTGPLESVIKSLNREIGVKEKECQQMQAYWLKQQNELVLLLNRSSEMSDEILRLQMKLTVLKRKKIEMDSRYESESRQIVQYKRSIKNLQKQIEKISFAISNQSNLEKNLSEKNFGLEQEIRIKLKDGESDLLRLSLQIEETFKEKERALEGIVEAEKQIMLWEKKIQLAKETQSALDPNIGASEITDMHQEIHRMKLRHQSLLKLQEKMITDMERAVEKREMIGGRTRAKAKGSAQMVLERNIADLTKKIKQIVYDIEECEQDTLTLQTAQQRIEQKFSESENSMGDLEIREKILLQELERFTFEKSISTNATLVLQKLQKRLVQPKTLRNPALVTQELEKYQTQLAQIKELIKEIEQTKYRDLVAPISDFIDIKIN